MHTSGAMEMNRQIEATALLNAATTCFFEVHLPINMVDETSTAMIAIGKCH